MAKSFVASPLSALAVAVLLAASSASPSAAAARHPARKAAAGQNKVSVWLKQCDTEELACENRLLKVTFAKTACIPGDDADSYVLTPKVRAWFAAHPAHNKDGIDNGINAALTNLYPCPK